MVLAGPLLREHAVGRHARAAARITPAARHMKRESANLLIIVFAVVCFALARNRPGLPAPDRAHGSPAPGRLARTPPALRSVFRAPPMDRAPASGARWTCSASPETPAPLLCRAPPRVERAPTPLRHSAIATACARYRRPS